MVKPLTRFHRVVNAAAIGLLVGVIISRLIEQSPAAAIIRGDFPAFYTMAVIASGAEPLRLYDIDLQRQIQNTFWPSMNGDVLPIAYPPYLAYLLQPLAALTPSSAHLVWSAFMVCAALAGVLLVCRTNKSLVGFFQLVAVGLFVFPPLLVGIFGGQIVSLSVLAYATILYLARLSDRRTEALLGLVAGLWMFKPHYGLSAALVLLLQKRWLALMSYAGTLSVLWVLGAFVAGPAWISTWAAFAGEFSHIDLSTNAYQMTGFLPLLYVVAPVIVGAQGEWSELTWSLVTVAVAALIPLGLVVSVRVANRSLPPSRLLPFLVLGPLLVLCAPAVNFYDLALALLPLLIVFQPAVRSEQLVALGVILLSWCGSLLRENKVPGVSFFFALLFLCLLMRGLRREWPRGIAR